MSGRERLGERSSRARLAATRSRASLAVSCLVVVLAPACTDFSGLTVPKDAALEAGSSDAGAEEASTADAAEDALSDAGTCVGRDLHFEATTGRCYRVVTTAYAWAAAESDCVVWGGHLVSVGDAAEDAVVTALIGANVPLPDAPDGLGVWMGLNDIQTEGKYVWTDGTPFTFNNWSKGEPDASLPDKDCIYHYGPHFLGTWDDFQCTAKEPYICER